MPKCITCGSNFTEKSKSDFKAAPAWKDECPACTKKKFEKYLSEYLLKYVRPDGLVTIAKQYFGDSAVRAGEGDPEAKIVAAVTELVYSRREKLGAIAPATTGHAIAGFVAFSDDAIKEIEKPDRKVKRNMAMLVAAAAGIVAIMLLLYFLA